ncbi:hypothetical protein RRU92_07115 [Streptococcus sp. DTU_2020_1001019_1_SI_AUS_MUR_006]|uniref:hypothetical protein n=1 Tax=Streptococcus sp. DTU_2020_1001019_1_SI_AUS_MUR_006 TaxID=3077584 RepID=UPI0028EE636A|nr:hypothetical protein [Streptococcus sp. DTU_2020_1001019_1_SI_AUS_MUR_006]WNS71897.1 hypothetical protein RRU92_07115 [Streptococcus sp. DTU_2020_1001019_1_SI_AUS_MUR_006]
MRVNYKNTPEKYQAIAEKIIPDLLDLLKSLTLLEEEIFERNRALDKEKEGLGIPSNQLHPLWNELMDDYFQRQMQLLTGRVTPQYLQRGPRNSYASPSEYNYVQTNDFSVDFIMTKAEEARIITHFQEALEMKHQFVLRLVDGNWLLDEKFYGFEDEETWYLDSL